MARKYLVTEDEFLSAEMNADGELEFTRDNGEKINTGPVVPDARLVDAADAAIGLRSVVTAGTPSGGAASASWVDRYEGAPVQALITATIEEGGVEQTVSGMVPVIGDDGRIASGLIDTAGVLADRASPAARLLVKQYGGRYVLTDPEFGGIGDDATDNTAAFNAAIAAANADGGVVFVPPQGAFRIDGLTDPVRAATIEGAATSYADPTTPITRGSVLRAGSPMGRLVQLGTDPTSSSQVDTSAGVRHLFLDGRDLADDVVLTKGRRWFLDGGQVYWGALNGVHVQGQNGSIHGWTVVAQNNKGNCVRIATEPDNKIVYGQLRQPGSDGACLLFEPLGGSSVGVGNSLVFGVHMWTGQNGVPLPGTLIRLKVGFSRTVGGIHIIGNELEGVIGNQIEMINANAGAAIRGIMINSNNIFQNSATPDDTYSFLAMSGVGPIMDITMQGNVFYGPSTSRRLRSFVHDEDGNDANRMRFQMSGNALRRVVKPWSNGPTSTWSGPEPGINVGIGADGADWKTRYTDSTTLTGADGTATTFTVVTGLPFTSARSVSLTPLSAAAAKPHFAFLDGGNLKVTFDTPPTAGADLRVSYDIWQ